MSSPCLNSVMAACLNRFRAGAFQGKTHFNPALALQLPTYFEMRTLSGGLVSSAPE